MYSVWLSIRGIRAILGIIEQVYQSGIESVCEKIVDELAAVCLLCGLCQYCSVSILNFILQVRWLEGSSSIFHMGKNGKA